MKLLYSFLLICASIAPLLSPGQGSSLNSRAIQKPWGTATNPYAQQHDALLLAAPAEWLLEEQLRLHPQDTSKQQTVKSATRAPEFQKPKVSKKPSKRKARMAKTSG